MKSFFVFFALYLTCVWSGAVLPPCLFTKKLTPATITGDARTGWKVSPDKTTVSYRLNAGSNDELWTVPLKGGVAVKVSPALSATGDVATNWQWTKDSSKVVFQAQTPAAAGGDGNLYSNSKTGGTPVLLNGALAADRSITQFMLSPDSTRAVYFGDVNTDGKNELYSVLLAGPAPGTLLSNASNPDVIANTWKVTSPTVAADAKAVWAENNQATFSSTSATLYAAPLAGGRVNLRPYMSGRQIFSFDTAGAQKSTHAVFHGNYEANNTRNNLYSVALTGGAITRLNAALPDFDSVVAYSVSPDGMKVAYAIDVTAPSPDVTTIWIVNPDGTMPSEIKLGTLMTIRDSTVTFSWSSNSAYLFIQGQLETSGSTELWSYAVATPGTAAAKLNKVRAGGDVRSFQVSPDFTTVAIEGDFDTAFKEELYVVGITGANPAVVKVSARANSNDITGYAWASTSSHVVWWFNSGLPEVASAPKAGGAQTVLSPTAVSGSDLGSTGAQITADGLYVAFRGDLGSTSEYRLWSAPIGGPAPAVTSTKVPTGTSSSADVDAYRVAPTGNKIVYNCDCEESSDEYIYSIGALATGVNVRLNKNQPASRSIGEVNDDFTITGSENGGGNWVIYRADIETSNDDLYSAAIACAVSTTGTSSSASSLSYSFVWVLVTLFAFLL